MADRQKYFSQLLDFNPTPEYTNVSIQAAYNTRRYILNSKCLSIHILTLNKVNHMINNNSSYTYSLQTHKMNESFDDDYNEDQYTRIGNSNSIDANGTEYVRLHLVTMMDDFINQILKIRRTLLGVSLSALILAPVAIVLSLFLLRHQTFFAVLEVENEFGIVLSILLLLIVIISTCGLSQV
jgi:hypothetical protein